MTKKKEKKPPARYDAYIKEKGYFYGAYELCRGLKKVDSLTDLVKKVVDGETFSSGYYERTAGGALAWKKYEREWECLPVEVLGDMLVHCVFYDAFGLLPGYDKDRPEEVAMGLAFLLMTKYHRDGGMLLGERD